ncbi:hypothetical protein JCM18899A_55000 [Nocardioides sp. AN3]
MSIGQTNAISDHQEEGNTTAHGKGARLGQVGIAVADIESAVDFYTGVLGMWLTETFDTTTSSVRRGCSGKVLCQW